MAEEALGVLAGQRISALIAGMTGERFFGAPYRNVPTVERTYRALAQVSRFPHVCVLIQNQAEPEPAASVGDMVSQLVPYEFLVVGYADATADFTSLEWAIRLSEDVTRTLYANHALGGVCHRLALASPEFFQPAGATAAVAQTAEFELIVTATLQRAITVAPGA